MRRLFALVLLLVLTVSTFAQEYRPKSGETVLKLSIEGRGDVFIRLFGDRAPKTVAQITRLAKKGFYDGLRFHRVVRTPRPYLVQVGDPESKSASLDQVGGGGSGTKIPYEDSGMSNVEGAVGLARTVEDRESGDSQFYILLAAQKFLDGHYTVFGKVVSGMDVIHSVERGDRITTATILQG